MDRLISWLRRKFTEVEWQTSAGHVRVWTFLYCHLGTRNENLQKETENVSSHRHLTVSGCLWFCFISLYYSGKCKLVQIYSYYSMRSTDSGTPERRHFDLHFFLFFISEDVNSLICWSHDWTILRCVLPVGWVVWTTSCCATASLVAVCYCVGCSLEQQILNNDYINKLKSSCLPIHLSLRQYWISFLWEKLQ